MHYSIPYAQTLHPGLNGDEDPRKRGILRNTHCRSYREQLQSTRHSNILQGLMILTGMATVLVVIWFHGMEQLTVAQDELDQLPVGGSMLGALWLGIYGLLGLDSLNAAKKFKEGTARAYYCSQELNTMRMFRQIGKQVFNQEQALARLERVVKSDRGFKSVALLGPPGVGKTLTGLALSQQFPWSENVHSYSWSTYVPDGALKFQMMRNLVEQLSDCGQNLLIIDNLSTCDYGIVPIYNKLLLEREGDPNAAVNQTVLVVYIFTLQMEYYWEQFELLQQQVPMDTTIINYRPFDRDELLDCLENELRVEQRTLDQRSITQILEQALIDVEDTGCKRMRQLIFQHGLSNLN